MSVTLSGRGAGCGRADTSRSECLKGMGEVSAELPLRSFSRSRK